MKKQPDFAGNTFGLLAMALIALALALLFGMWGMPQRIAGASEPTPTQDMTSPSPTETPTPAELTSTVPDLDDYVFGEPQVVLTYNSLLEIAGWLPDSERLLITRLDPISHIEFIETFNVNTGEFHRFSERNSIRSKPVWLPGLQAIAFAVYTGEEYELHISQDERGRGETRRISDLAYASIAAVNGGREVMFFKREAKLKPQLFDAIQGKETTRVSSIDLASFGDPEEVGKYVYSIASCPSGSKVAFYSRFYLFLADLSTGAGQEIDLGGDPPYQRWAYDAKWGPDGRYLAMQTATEPPAVSSTELTVLDTNTGESYQIDLGVPLVFDIAWAPNSQHLAVLGQADPVEGRPLVKLYLVDVTTGAFRQMLPNYAFALANWGLAWSPDGHTIAARCSAPGKAQICTIEVK